MIIKHRNKSDKMYIKIKVYPDSKEEKLNLLSKDSYEIFLREPPKEGMANRRLITLLSEKIEPKPKNLKIIKGHHSQSKIIEVRY